MDLAVARRRAIGFLITAAILWSTGGLLIKSTTWQPFAILVGRNLFSSAVLLLYVKRLPSRVTRWQIVAAASHLLTSFLFIASTKLTTATNAIFLQYTAPLYVTVLGYWFLREKPSRTDWISMLVIFCGMFLFFGERLSPSGLLGSALGALSGVTFALLAVSLRAQKHGTPTDSILIAQLLTVVVGFPLLLQESATTVNWLIIGFLGVFQIGIAFLLFTIGIKHVPAIEATLISTLEPILNPLWVAFFIGERPGPLAMAGALVVLAGVVVSAAGGARAARPRT
jgi:drug/metabolite transporter (DMT)-like permease